MSVGSRLQKIRKSKGFSIRGLAKRTGLTASFISQVERGLAVPSIPTLRTLAKVLDTPIFTFFLDEEVDETRVIIRREQRGIMTLPGSGQVYELLNPSPTQRIQMMVLRLDPGASTGPESQSHPGEEGVVVLRGAVNMELRGEVFELREGDSAYYPSEWPHRYVNNTGELCELLFCMTPPS